MNYDLIFAILFYIILIYVFYRNRKHVSVQGIIALYRTKLGLKLMDKTASTFRGFLKIIAYISILVGFAGMIFIFYFLIKSTFGLLSGGVPALAPVLPGVKISGLPNLGFWHWILAIFFVAVVHEFSHGVFARVYNIKIKSSGFALFGPILAAFVEPDEKKLKKKKKKERLAMLSAGPFSNIIFGLIFLLLLNFTMTPLQDDFYQIDGIKVNSFIADYPAESSGLEVPFVLYSVNNVMINEVEDFLKSTDEIKPDSSVLLGTDQGDFSMTAVNNPEDDSKGFVGIQNFGLEYKVREGKDLFLASFVKWLFMLVFWLFVVNIGVGLFNLLPLGPVDGGRMFKEFGNWLLRDEKKGHKLYVWVSLFCLFLILINLMPYIIKLLMFIAKPFLYLLGV